MVRFANLDDVFSAQTDVYVNGYARARERTELCFISPGDGHHGGTASATFCNLMLHRVRVCATYTCTVVKYVAVIATTGT